MMDDSVLFFWRVSAMQQEALDVIKAWGFTLKSELVWIKGTPEKLAFGMGRYTRMAHEVCLIATRGKFKVQDRSIRSVFFAPRREHSRKPDEFFHIVEAMTDGPYVETFAREVRPGWTQYGNELPGGKATP
jgi:N6-adenosine-specific RNA methylase IME4